MREHFGEDMPRQPSLPSRTASVRGTLVRSS